MLPTKIGLRDYFVPIFIFLSGVSAQLSGVHHFFTFLFSFLFVSFFVFNIVYNKHGYNFDLKLLVIVSLYVLWCFISVLISKYQLVALVSLGRIIIFFIIVFGIYNYMNSSQRINLVLKSIIYVGTAVSISILSEFLYNRLRLINYDGSILRYSGIFTGENAAGFVIGISMVIIAYKYLNTWYRSYIFLFLVNLLAIILTFSRSSWIMVVITLIPYIFQRFIPRVIFRYIMFALLMLTVSFAFNSNKVLMFLRLNNGNSGRDIIWKAAGNLVKDNPFGVGIGCLSMEIPDYYNVPKGSWLWNTLQDTANDAHNLYLTVTSETGWIGLFILLLALGYFFKVLATNYRLADATYSLEKLFFYLFFGFLARSFFEGNGFLTKGWIGIDIYMWIIFIITIKLNSIKDESINYR